MYAGGEENQTKKNEILLSAHIAVHSSIKAVDHLGEIVAGFSQEKTLKDTKLHQSKCSMIIKNLIAESLRKGYSFCRLVRFKFGLNWLYSEPYLKRLSYLYNVSDQRGTEESNEW